MKFICNLFEPRYKILTYMWRIGIECKMQQIWGVSYRCEDCACMLHIISLRAQISRNVKYWYEICDVLVPICYALWRIGTDFSQCEICEMWNLRFNSALTRLLFWRHMLLLCTDPRCQLLLAWDDENETEGKQSKLMSRGMRFPTIWHFDKSRLRRAFVVSF